MSYPAAYLAATVQQTYLRPAFAKPQLSLLRYPGFPVKV
jgi:hypothetical protein